eukprot:scaffold667318_cov69-Prasinocladus_malaysianus.AAC.1
MDQTQPATLRQIFSEWMIVGVRLQILQYLSQYNGPEYEQSIEVFGWKVKGCRAGEQQQEQQQQNITYA